MKLVPERAGPHQPLPATSARVPGSIRRTSTLDFRRDEGLEGAVRLDARSRDLLTRADGTPDVLGAASLVGTIDWSTRTLTSIESDPAARGLSDLVGAPTAAGFRARLAAAVPDEIAARSLLHLLLDDLPGAELVSGYALQRAGTYGAMPVTEEGLAVMVDLCAGWAGDATLFEVVRNDGVIATPMGPPAPQIERDDDPLGWHVIEPLGAHGSRRRRCLDLAPKEDPDVWRFAAHFRDSHMDDAGAETVVHEYTVDGSVDATSRRLLDAQAAARVLPWVECPGAVPSAAGMAGTPLADLRHRVRREMRGVHTCTHLNDTMRTIADLDVLVDALVDAT
jgi:hypothetical protein